RDRGGMDTSGRLGHRHPLHAMHAALELEPAPGAAALDEQDDVLEPAGAGDARVHHLDLPALALGVLRVHAAELGREQRRLVATGARTNLHEDVLVVVGIAGQQQALEVNFQGALARRELVDLGLGQLGQLSVAALGRDVLSLAHLAKNVAVPAEAPADLLPVGVLLGEAGVLGLLREDGGARQPPGDLLRPLFDLAELVKQHGGSAPPARKRPPRPAYCCAAGCRLYFRWKRSTRPAVSMSFCLPVKNGWHFEQTSTRMSGLVERVLMISPHAQVIVVSTYSG